MYDESYMRYRNIRTMAWELLIRHEVKELPVDVIGIAEKLAVKVLSYDNAEELIMTCALETLRTSNDAFSLYTDRWYILFDAERETQRFAIAHELAHILLKHTTAKKKIGVFTAYHSTWNRDEPTMRAEEQEANRFAVRLLAPACVIRHLRQRDAHSIAMLCGLPRREAFERAERMDKLIAKGNFLIQNEEARVYEQFETFLTMREDLFVHE